VKPYVVVALVGVFVAARLWRRSRARRTAVSDAGGPPEPPAPSRWGGGAVGPVRLVAAREVRERTRSRVFRIGTAVILLAVAAAVVVPVLHKGSRSHLVVGVAGTAVTEELRSDVAVGAAAAGVTASVVSEPDVSAARDAVRRGDVSLAVVDGTRIVVRRVERPGDTSDTAQLAHALAAQLGLEHALVAAGLSPAEAGRVAHAEPVPVTGLLPAPKSHGTAEVTALYGLILMFVLLSQYGTWILLGVVEEKSSRVVEVLLSTVRPSQLLSGKVLGIGTVAAAQGALIVAVALGLAAAVGSDLVRGTAPLEVACVLCWTVLGYVFYCWVYAAGGALAERQEHVQSLAFPLQLPILVGYIVSLTAIGATTTPLFVRILAYLPPTAPFAMTVMVAQGTVTWWQFAASVLLTIAATVAVARAASAVYRRAILLTGRRIRIREVLHVGG